MHLELPSSWHTQLQNELDKLYFKDLLLFLEGEYKFQTVFPLRENIFKAFELCPWETLKVVLIGQDPYHGPHQAHGLCFSVNEGIALPPSLKNIYKEMSQDLGTTKPQSGNLSFWASQGILMLNATLTVRKDEPESHQNKGWEIFTDAVIAQIATHKSQLVYILWGAYAQKKSKQIDKTQNLVLSSAHPSPFSANRGFFGSKPFSQTNVYLQQQGKTPIIWNRDESLFHKIKV